MFVNYISRNLFLSLLETTYPTPTRCHGKSSVERKEVEKAVSQQGKISLVLSSNVAKIEDGKESIYQRGNPGAMEKTELRNHSYVKEL